MIHKSGFKNITAVCEQAKNDGYSYVWVDTNCIDKSSSAELTEAINSVFAWYNQASICYAYLSDVKIFKSLLYATSSVKAVDSRGDGHSKDFSPLER
jgi:hypothetical protein